METSIEAVETKELDRRTDALLEASRIELYLPVLEVRAAELEEELAETRELIADETQALRDLRYEGKCTPSQIRARYRRQGRELPV